MEIILSPQCESLTGSLGRGFGYHIQRRTDLDGTTRFWGVRNSIGAIPPDGHWRFIVACAELAQNGLHIADIKVSAGELDDALEDATEGMKQSPWVREAIVNAEQVLTLKRVLGL